MWVGWIRIVSEIVSGGADGVVRLGRPMSIGLCLPFARHVVTYLFYDHSPDGDWYPSILSRKLLVVTRETKLTLSIALNPKSKLYAILHVSLCPSQFLINKLKWRDFKFTMAWFVTVLCLTIQNLVEYVLPSEKYRPSCILCVGLSFDWIALDMDNYDKLHRVSEKKLCKILFDRISSNFHQFW